MKRIGMGIVGAGFVGPHHIDAVRRLGYVDVVAVAGSSQASAEKKAEALGARKAYGSYEALLDDPDVQVVHNATPNYLHYPVNAAAIAKGKHVISDKPLAMTAAEAKKLLDQATKAGIVHAVTFNYRGNPLVQQARTAIARGDIGRPHVSRRPVPAGLAAQGHRLLVAARAGQGRRVVGARRHRLALVRSRAAHQRPAHHARARRHHDRHPEAQEAEGLARGVRRRRRRPEASRTSTSRSRTSRRCCCGSTTARRAASRSGRSAPGTRTISQLEICGSKRVAAMAPGAPERALDRPSRQGRTRCCRRIRRCSTPRRRATRICRAGTRRRGRTPSANVMRDIYGFIAAGKKPSDPHPPAFATFEDGYRANCIVEAILESARNGQRVDEGPRIRRRERYDNQTVRTEVHEGGRPDGGAPGTDAARGARSGSGPRDRGVGGVREGAGRELHPAVGGAASDRDRRAARGDARSGREHARPAQAVRQGPRARASSAALDANGIGISEVGYFDNMLHHDPAIREEEARLHAARVRRGGAARRRRGLRVRRPQPAAQHGPEPASTSSSSSCRCSRKPRRAG